MLFHGYVMLLRTMTLLTLWKDMFHKGSRFADLVRFRPYTYARTQQSLMKDVRIVPRVTLINF